MSTKDIGINTKTVRIPLPRIEGVELKNATVDLERGIVVAEYGQEDLYRTVKTGDFLTCLSDPSKTVIFNSIAPPIGKMKVFTILYDLPILINGKEVRTLLGAKFPFSNFRYSTEEEKSLMIEEMEKLGKRYNPKTFKIEDMTKEESIRELEIGKDYVNLHDNDVVVIDRVSDILNKGFERLVYKNCLSCSGTSNWREATEEEVIEAFKKHLVHRYGEDWETMKIKEEHPSSSLEINDGSWSVDISKWPDGWNVWNKNGLLYCKGIWVERLEEPPKLTGGLLSPEDIKEIKAGEKVDKSYVLKKDVLTILSVESKFNPDKKLSEYLKQFKLILEVL